MIVSSRACRKCNEIKPITAEFWQAIPNSTDGFRKTCRACKTASDSVRYQAKRKETIERAGAWYKANKPRKQEYDRQFRLANIERIRESKRIANRKRMAKFPLARLFRNCYSNSRRFEPSERYQITRRDLSRLINRQRSSCFYCESPFSDSYDVEIDHVIPKSRGGKHSIGNLVLACVICNREKSYRLLMEYRLQKVVHRA